VSSGGLYYQIVETSGATASVKLVTKEKKGENKKVKHPFTGLDKPLGNQGG